jgi:Zn-dependent protease with chaperone function
MFKQRLIVVLLSICLAGQMSAYLLPSMKRVGRLQFIMSAVTAPTQLDSVLSFKGLEASMFAHPIDVQVTKSLSQVPLVESLTRSLFNALEQALVVESLGTSILVGPNQMPNLYKYLLKAATILDMDVPDLYIKQNPLPNAYTLAFNGNKPFVVVHTGLLDLLNDDEILAVLGHELGHLKCEHGVWVTSLTFMVQLADSLVGAFLPLRSLLLWWQRSAEYSCDRASLLVAKDYKIVASVLMKLCGGSNSNSHSKNLNVDAFLAQAKQLEKEKQNIAGNMYIFANEQLATHPIPLVRAIELMRWSDSAQYSGLIQRAVQVRTKM